MKEFDFLVGYSSYSSQSLSKNANPARIVLAASHLAAAGQAAFAQGSVAQWAHT